MARASLGSLVVSLGLDAAEFVSGLSKAEYEARKFKQRLERDLQSAAQGVGVALAAIPLAAAAALTAIDQLVKHAANFQDLEEKVGGSAEAFASFAVSAAVANTPMESIAAASVKLTKALTGVDDESAAAGAALAALGLPIKEFKRLDAAQQMVAVAKAMSEFEDGTSKTAVALALFGRSGAEVLPFLKELAREGGVQIILTKEQIKQADDYADAQARLRAEISLYAQAAAIETLPAINALISAFKDQIAVILGLKDGTKLLTVEGKNAIFDWASDVIRAFAFVVDAADGVARVFKIVGLEIAAFIAIRENLFTFNLQGAKTILKSFAADVEAVLARPMFGDKVKQSLKDAALLRGIAGGTETGSPDNSRKKINFEGGAKNAKAQKAATSEAEKYLEALQRQLDGIENLTVAEKLLADVRAGRLKLDSSKITFEQLDALAREIDARIALKKQLEEEAKTREQTSRAATKELEAANADVAKLAESNAALKDEISLIGKDATARADLERSHIAVAIAAKEEAVAMLEIAGASESLIAVRKQEIALLKERGILVGQKGVAEQAAEDAKKAKEFVDSLGMSFASAFEDAIVQGNNLRDVLKGLEQDIVRIVTRKLVTEPLAKSISDILGGAFGSGGGGSSGGWLQAIIGSLFGSAGGGGGWTSGSDLPMGSFASGGMMRAGQLSLVGERGPELVVPSTSSRVLPNGSFSTAKNVNMPITINVPNGTGRATADQIAARTAMAAQRAIRRIM